MPTVIDCTTDRTEFLTMARAFLGARPVEHSVILTNAAHGPLEGEWTSVVRDGEVVAASMLTPPHPLQVSLGGDDDLRAVAEHHHAAGRRLPGVGGMRLPASVFAGHWSRLRGVAVSERMALGVFVCDQLLPPAAVEGVLRPARQADERLLVSWGREFVAEIAHGVEEDAGMEPRVRRGQVHVWERAGKIVSMAALSSREHGYSRVQLVYTPPGQRGARLRQCLRVGAGAARDGGWWPVHALHRPREPGLQPHLPGHRLPPRRRRGDSRVPVSAVRASRLSTAVWWRGPARRRRRGRPVVVGRRVGWSLPALPMAKS